MKRKIKKGLGFTLVDLLASLGIIAILTGFAVPAFSNLLELNRSRIVRDTLQTAINFTRIEAISRATVVTLCPKSTENSCGKDWSEGILIFVDHDEDGKITDEEFVLREVPALSEAESLRWSSFGSNNYLRYTALGDTLNQNGSFIYCPSSGRAEYAQGIIINRSGRARSALDSDGNGVVERASGEDIEC